mgnify:FL=1
MNTIYLLSAGSQLRKNGGRIEILEKAQQRIYSILPQDVDSVVAGGHTQISTEAMYLLLQNNCQITYIDRRGSVIAYLGDGHQSLEKLLLQQKAFANIHIVRKLINDTIGIKIANQRKLLAYYASSMNDPILWTASKTIKMYEEKLRQCSLVESARGIEGMASKIYFEAFGNIFDAKRWDWQGRNRRPPRDPINSMLSYGYAFLEREVRTGIAGTGLDPRIGFFHSNNGRKDSLVFDLMEMFRQNIIDKFVLKLINRHSFYPIDFTVDEEIGCRLSDAAGKHWIRYYEDYMEEKRKMLDGLSWRQYIQQEIGKFAASLTMYSCQEEN